MTHTITAPRKIESSLYEGQLELTDMAAGEIIRGIPPINRQKLAGPVVTLGKPQYWNLAMLAREKGEYLPAELALQLREADFYLLELAWSFRPERNAKVTWARIDAYLQPRAGNEAPIVFDLCPREIYNETKTDWKVVITPSLNFTAFEGIKVEGKLGEMLTTISFKKLEPVIVGHGLLQSNCGWDFESSRNNPLRGVKSGYLIVKKPRSAEAVRLILDVKAEVVTHYGKLSMGVTEKDKAHLSLIVCAD